MTMLTRAMIPAPGRPAKWTASRGSNVMRLESARDQFITDKRLERRSPFTLRTYHEHLRGFTDWMAATHGERDARHFSADRAREYLGHRSVTLNRAQNTLNLDSTVLREFAAWGVRRRYWPRDTVEDIPAIGKPRSLPRPYDPAERDALLALPLDPEDRVLRALLHFAGLRSAEVRGLRLQNIIPPHDTLPGVLRVLGKGMKERIVPIPPQLWTELEAYLRTLPAGTTSDRTLLAKRDGRPWSRHMVELRIQAWGRQAQVAGAKAHRFRHGYATHMLEQTSDLRLVQDLLGHASPATTAIYTQVSDRRKAEAVVRAFQTLATDSRRQGSDAVETAANPASIQGAG